MSADAAAAAMPIDPAQALCRPLAREGYRPEIDGLRAIAVLPVILFHAGIEAFSGGYVGVDVFFAISGYLITTIILTEQREGRFRIAKFYERRARRILPALFTVLLFCIPFAWWWMRPDELAGFGKSLAAVALFVSNFVFWSESGYFGGAAELKPLLHTWSLGIEEQYYVFFPLLILLLLRFGMAVTIGALTVIALGSLGISAFLTALEPMANFFLLPSRTWELLGGSILACYVVTGKLPPLARRLRPAVELAALALILVPVFLYDETTPFPGIAAVPPVVGTLILLAYSDARSLAGRLLASPPLLAVGLVSYSAYLWHQPLFAFARLISPDELPAAVLLALAVAALALAGLSWRFIEAPFRDRRNFSRRQIFALAAAGSMLFVAVGATLSLSRGAPERVDARYRHLVMAPDTLLKGCPSVGDGLHECVIGAPGTPAIALVGDSHSYALAHSLDAELKRRGLAGIVVHTDCHPVPGIFDSREPLDEARRAACGAANKRLIARVTSDGIAAVIVAIRWTARLVPVDGAVQAAHYDNGEGGVEGDMPARRNLTIGEGGRADVSFTAKAAAVRVYVERLAQHQQVALIYPIPEAGWTPARLNMIALARGRSPAASITTSHARFRARNAAAFRALDSIAPRNVHRVKPEDLLCSRFVAGRCVVQHDNTLFYLDDDHLSADGARPIVREALSRVAPSVLTRPRVAASLRATKRPA